MGRAWRGVEKAYGEEDVEVYFAPSDDDVMRSILRMLSNRRSTIDEILASLRRRYGFFGETRLRKMLRYMLDKGYIREVYEGKRRYFYAVATWA